MLVFRPFLEMVHGETGGIWSENVDTIYAALVVDGGQTPPDRSWQTMLDVLQGGSGFARATGSSDMLIANTVRTAGWTQSQTPAFPPYSMIYGFNGQINFSTLSAGQNLKAVCVYWDSVGTQADATNRLLFWDDLNVDASVTSTGANVWGATGNNECVAITSLTSTPGSYIMGGGVQQMHNGDNWWTVSRNFVLRAFQPTTIQTVTNPAGSQLTLANIETLGHARVQADAGGDLPDITIAATSRQLGWDNSTSGKRHDFIIDPGGSNLSFGLAAGGQTVAAVALADSATGEVWYWDSVFSDKVLTGPTTLTYGPSSPFTIFSHRLLTS